MSRVYLLIDFFSSLVTSKIQQLRQQEIWSPAFYSILCLRFLWRETAWDLVSIIHLPRKDEETGSGGIPEGTGNREGKPLGCFLHFTPLPPGIAWALIEALRRVPFSPHNRRSSVLWNPAAVGKGREVGEDQQKGREKGKLAAPVAFSSWSSTGNQIIT